MSGRILDRYASRENGKGVVDDENEGLIEDFGSFGFLRGSRERAAMLQLTKKGGNILAISYGYVDKAEFDPSEGITLHHAGQKIRIMGRNLNVDVPAKVRLFDAICRHRVPWLREANEADQMTASENNPIIESIEW